VIYCEEEEKMSLILSHDELFAFAEQESELFEDLLKAFVGVPTVSSEAYSAKSLPSVLNTKYQ
jgi:hypothetical protein